MIYVEHFDQLEKALADLNKAIELVPDEATAYIDRGLIYKNLGQKVQAFADIAKAIDLTPPQFSSYGYYYFLFSDFENPDFQKLITDLTETIAAYPDQAYLYRIRGYIYERMEHYEAAIADYQQAIEFEPEHLGAYCDLGALYLRTGSYDLAVAALEIGVKSEVNVPRNHRWCTARLEEARVLAATPAP